MGTPEWKKKISRARRGIVSWNKGKKTPEGVKRKLSKALLGKKSYLWKGGRIVSKEGYVFVYQPTHPYSHTRHVREHRLIVEKYIGRYLLPTEPVHHLGKKDDNNPRMLMAFASISAHSKFEQGGKVKPSEILFDGRKLVTACLILFSLLFSTPLSSIAAGGLKPTYRAKVSCQTAEIDPHKLADAIYKAEGGKKTRYPYGIKSVRCVGENDCRQVCLNTIRNNQKRFLKQNKYTDFIEFLGSRYCPLNIKGEYHLNKNWVSNVKYFYVKESK
jgi:hypothetical protein